VTPKPKLLVATLPRWKENLLYYIGKIIGLKGLPIGFIYYEDEEEENLMTINDIKRQMEEDAMNREEN